jgi:hypothetical protein
LAASDKQGSECVSGQPVQPTWCQR